MHWRLIAPNLLYLVGSYWLFLAIAQPSADCFWFRPAIYGNFAIALLCYLTYTSQFLRYFQGRWQQLMHLTTAGILFFLIWSLGTITSIRAAMQFACPNTLFSAHTSGTQFDQYSHILFFLMLFAPMFGLSLLGNAVLWKVQRRKQSQQ